jgi:hypothetical protein
MADGTIGYLDVTRGFTGHSKCTFLLVAENGKVAPTFELYISEYVHYLLHWVEWININALGADAVLSNDV